MLSFSELTETIRGNFVCLDIFLSSSEIRFPFPSPLRLSCPCHPGAPTRSQSQEELQEGEHGSFVTCTDERIKDLFKSCPPLAARVGALASCAWIRSRRTLSPSPLNSTFDLEHEGINPQHRAVRPAPNPLADEGQYYHVGKVNGNGLRQPPSLRLLLHYINFIYRLLNRRRKERGEGEDFYLTR